MRRGLAANLTAAGLVSGRVGVRRMRNLLVAALATCALSTAAASAQSYPGDSGEGTQRGIQQLKNSGQVGIVTLFRHDTHTRIFVEMHGTGGKTELVRLMRGADCDALAATPTYILADLKNGVSRTELDISEDRLLSGNYNVIIFHSIAPGAGMAACGHL
jgi:hypothetical protein